MKYLHLLNFSYLGDHSIKTSKSENLCINDKNDHENKNKNALS